MAIPNLTADDRQRRLVETAIDMAMMVPKFRNDSELNSRLLVDRIHAWALEFEEQFTEEDDNNQLYLEKVEEFFEAKFKASEYVDLVERKKQIVIILDGGLIQSVYNAGDCEVVVLDMDTDGADEEDLEPNPWRNAKENEDWMSCGWDTNDKCFVRIAPDDGPLPYREIGEEEHR